MDIVKNIYCVHCNIYSEYHFDENKLKGNNKIEIKCNNCNKLIIISLDSLGVYLARTFLVSDAKYKYPVAVKKDFQYQLNIIDPWDYEKEIIIKDYDKEYKKIIKLDKKLIKKSDVCTFFINFPSFGTISELFYSKLIHKPIYIYNENRIYTGDPWLKSYASNGIIYEDYREMFKDILKKYLYGI